MLFFLLFTDNELYSGTVADFSGSDPIIYREPLQTEQYDSLSLNGKLFTSSPSDSPTAAPPAAIPIFNSFPNKHSW